MRAAKSALLSAALLGLLCAPAGAQQPAHLVIVPTYDNSILSDPNGSTIVSTISSAIQVYQNTFANPITVNITFSEMSSGLGQSLTYVGQVGYGTYRNALVTDKLSGGDTAFLNYLPASNDPTYSGKNVRVTTANFRALGFNVTPPIGKPDSTISLNTSLMNLSRATNASDKYDLYAVASHEIDEALGLGSALNGGTVPAGLITGEDLFRYAAAGTRSFNVDPDAQAYFSVDGGQTALVYFNQDSRGDFQDWYSIGQHTPEVQDAFGTPGVQINLGTNEVMALRVVGYNLAAAPEPPVTAGFLLGGLGLAGLIVARRRRPAASS